ncbi:phosphohistidine phosphatase SixA [Conservatibacter flavescens]|uniref:Phosphohistidine phosphatase SixA n=1 Tax=Conservatibacter flavescens TaxID=28161 RepID=A0A2M8S629_9PAST|nr:phosphohistidine phosphatase SixA [Conservatibacter flavescens]PJG86590.1 phosphohistidine phosphatase SixA [Conservatibacter flavescens]
MKVYIMRHGEAELMVTTDAERCLTEYGVRQSFEQGKHLKAVASSIQKIIVSPYTRARQTFEQVNLACENQLIKPEIWEEIIPYGNAKIVCDYLATLIEEGVESVLLVSHLPVVGSIVSEMCGRNSVSFQTSTIAVLDWNGEKGEVVDSYHYGEE